MDQLTQIILQAGRSAVELSLFVLLPIMVVMLSLMRLLEQGLGLQAFGQALCERGLARADRALHDDVVCLVQHAWLPPGCAAPR